jgi:hypothetical protein
MKLSEAAAQETAPMTAGDALADSSAQRRE